MTAKTLLSEAKRLELLSRKLVDQANLGEERSLFFGSGMQFSEHRFYADGDDIRRIDWKVSARAREWMVKKFEEEREKQVVLVVDHSLSMAIGGVNRSKWEMAQELAAILGYAAFFSKDRLGYVFFSEGLDHRFAPVKSKQAVLSLIKATDTLAAEGKGTGFAAALKWCLNGLKGRSLIILISDFEGMNEEAFGILKKCAVKNDLIAFPIFDPYERHFPPIGGMSVRDVKSGKIKYLSARDFAAQGVARGEFETQLVAQFKKSMVDYMTVSTQESTVHALEDFFKRRAFGPVQLNFARA